MCEMVEVIIDILCRVGPFELRQLRAKYDKININ